MGALVVFSFVFAMCVVTGYMQFLGIHLSKRSDHCIISIGLLLPLRLCLDCFAVFISFRFLLPSSVCGNVSYAKNGGVRAMYTGLQTYAVWITTFELFNKQTHTLRLFRAKKSRSQ